MADLTDQGIDVVLAKFDRTEPALQRKIVAALAAKAAGRDAAWDALRSLACWLGVGGYNAEMVDAGEFERKIRAGIDDLVRVENAKARGPQISDSEQMALLRRTIKSVEAERDAALERAAKGDAFKQFVHSYLDAAGVPASDPTNRHEQEGCRIGARIDWLLARLVVVEKR